MVPEPTEVVPEVYSQEHLTEWLQKKNKTKKIFEGSWSKISNALLLFLNQPEVGVVHNDRCAPSHKNFLFNQSEDSD